MTTTRTLVSNGRILVMSRHAIDSQRHTCWAHAYWWRELGRFPEGAVQVNLEPFSLSNLWQCEALLRVEAQ